MSSNRNHVVAAVGITAAVAASVAYILYTRRNRWRKVGKVSKLYVHPVKSTRGLDVDEADITTHGVALASPKSTLDRSFMITKPDGGMVTGRQEPKMVLIEAQIDDEFLILTAPRVRTLIITVPDGVSKAMDCRVWGEEIKGVDCGDEAAEWLKKYFDADYRLMFYPRQETARDVKDATGKDPNRGKAIYHDCAPCMLMSEASIAELNSRLESKVTERNFRPNILVSGCSAFAEDKWTDVKIGETEMTWVKFCSRCLLTTVDPEKGTKNAEGEPLKTLKSYRLCSEDQRHIYGSSPLLGVYYGVVKEGSIKVGDAVYVK